MFELMKILNKIVLYFLLITIFFSCKKDSYNTSPNAFINFSTDTLHFDTVFTSVGSVTQPLKIFNLNTEKIRINNIELAGGAASSFKINVNGAAGNSFSDIDIPANDSIYVFVTLNVNPNQLNTPFIIRDSIVLSYNGNTNFIQLDAYGRNAHFLKDYILTHDTTLTNDLPLIIYGSLTVNPLVTLTINKGTEIFCHQNAIINVDGTLKVHGEKVAGSQVTFRGDRLDEPYKYYPGSWQGISFSVSSFNNEINFAVIENAITAINITGNGNTSPQLKLNASIITNILNEGIKAINSNIYAENCLITNCGLNNINLNAGNYNFVYCTVAGYSDVLLSHSAPVLAISDTLSATQTAAFQANFTNSIFYGEQGFFDDEITLLQTGNSFITNFDHILYKAQNIPASFFINSISNSDPGFVNIDEENATFNFHLLPESICKDAGKPLLIATDLNGNQRTVGALPDLGCYEIQ